MIPKEVKKAFEKNAPQPKPTVLATIIITLDPENRDFKIMGNVVNNKEATVGMLIQALHRIYNESRPPQEISADGPPKPIITH